MTRVPILIFAISLFSTILEAQDHFYSTRNYTVKNGLPQSQVSSLLEDKNGYLWIGTHGGGLARFDGREFKVYTTLDGLLNNQIIGTQMDRQDNLWILHLRGLTKFNGRDFKKFEAPANALSHRSKCGRCMKSEIHCSFYPPEIRSQKYTTTRFITGKNPLEKNFGECTSDQRGSRAFI